MEHPFKSFWHAIFRKNGPQIGTKNVPPNWHKKRTPKSEPKTYPQIGTKNVPPNRHQKRTPKLAPKRTRNLTQKLTGRRPYASPKYVRFFLRFFFLLRSALYFFLTSFEKKLRVPSRKIARPGPEFCSEFFRNFRPDFFKTCWKKNARPTFSYNILDATRNYTSPPALFQTHNGRTNGCRTARPPRPTAQRHFPCGLGFFVCRRVGFRSPK